MPSCEYYSVSLINFHHLLGPIATSLFNYRLSSLTFFLHNFLPGFFCLPLGLHFIIRAFCDQLMFLYSHNMSILSQACFTVALFLVSLNSVHENASATLTSYTAI